MLSRLSRSNTDVSRFALACQYDRHVRCASTRSRRCARGYTPRYIAHQLISGIYEMLERVLYSVLTVHGLLHCTFVSRQLQDIYYRSSSPFQRGPDVPGPVSTQPQGQPPHRQASTRPPGPSIAPLFAWEALGSFCNGKPKAGLGPSRHPAAIIARDLRSIAALQGFEKQLKCRLCVC